MGIKERLFGTDDEGNEASLGDGTAETEAQTDPGFESGLFRSDLNRQQPSDQDLEQYWEIYKNFPLVRRSIGHFADDVVEPGYRIDTDNEALADELESWLQDAGMVSGEQNHGFDEILRSAVVQREVRGTSITVVVYNKNGGIWGFQNINVSTLSAYTYESKSVLIRPDEDPSHEDVPAITKRDEAAAYVQFDDDAIGGPFGDTEEVPFSQNDIVKVTRDADTDDIFGTSSIQPIHAEVKGLRQILRDNEEAIATKGYPQWFFKLGEPQGEPGSPRAGVWPDAKIQEYRDSHKKENYTAGQKDFVPGDVDVEKFDSDVAEIEELIDRYVDMIMAGLPVPKFMIGFANQINRDITGDQREQYQKQIQRTRRELEQAFEPILRRKADEWGYETDDVDLTIQPERDESPLKDDEFDANEFNKMMDGIIKVQEQAGGQIMTADEIRTQILSLPEMETGADENVDEVNPDDDDDPEPDAEADAERTTMLADDHQFNVGDYVQGPAGGGTWHGIVEDYKLDGCYSDRIDGDFTICANDDEAVYLIEDVATQTGERQGTMKAHLEGAVEPWDGPSGSMESLFAADCVAHGLDTERATLDVDDDTLDTVYADWEDAVNMTASELEQWSEHPCADEASVDPQAVRQRNLELLNTPKSEWTQGHVEDAQRTISFISRMDSASMTPDDPRGGPGGCPSPWAISLLNWAYNPFDELPDEPDTDESDA